MSSESPILPIRSGPIRFAVGSPDGVTSNSWKFWVEKSGVYLKCRDNFQIAKVSLHTGTEGRNPRWRMGFEDYVAKKYPGLISEGRNRAWEVWDEPPAQLPKTVVAFKLCFPDLELAVSPEQRKTRVWRKEIFYVDLRKRLPPGWMTVATLFVTARDVRLRHERDPSIWLGSLDMCDGRQAHLVLHGDPELDIYELICAAIEQKTAQARQNGFVITPTAYAYMLVKSSEGYRFLVGGRMSEEAQLERARRKNIRFPPIKGHYSKFVMEKNPTNLTFTYEQSPDFSVRYADGAGIKAMPGGNIYVAFYLERAHEFDTVVHELTADGKLKDVSSTSREGICRQLQSAIVVNPSAARSIANAILQTLDRLDTLDFVSTTPSNP